MAKGYTNAVGGAEEIGSITYKNKSNDPNYLLCDGSNTNKANFLGFNIGNMDELNLPPLSYQSWISGAFYYNDSIYCVQSPIQHTDNYPSILWESKVNNKKSWIKRKEQLYKSANSNTRVPNMCPANVIGDTIVMPNQSSTTIGSGVRMEYSTDGGRTWIEGQSFMKGACVETILYSCIRSNVMMLLTKSDAILSTTDGKNWVQRSRFDTDTTYYNVCNDVIFSSLGGNKTHYYSDDYGATFKKIGGLDGGYVTFRMLGYNNGHYYYTYSTLGDYGCKIYSSLSYKTLSHRLEYTFNDNPSINNIYGTCYYDKWGEILIYLDFDFDWTSSIAIFDATNRKIKLSNTHPVDKSYMNYINWGNFGKSLLLTTSTFPSASCISQDYSHTLPNYNENKRKVYIKIK